MYSGVISVCLVTLIIMGMALGMVRGFTKSWIRLIIVVADAVIAYFIAGAIGSAIANINISGMGQVINGNNVETVESLIEELLKSISIVAELIESSPTIGKVVSILPLAIINLVLFDVLFVLINFVTWIIYMIVFSIIGKKHKDEEQKPKRKGLGVLFGIIQSVVVFIVLFIPVMGLTYFVSEQVDYVNNYNGELEQVSQEGSASADEYLGEMVAFAEEKTSAEAEPENDTKEGAVKTAQEVTSSLENAWVFKALKFVGYDKLSMTLANNLTKFEINETKTGLFDEVENVVKISVRVEWLFGNKRQISSWTTKDIQLLQEVVGKFFDSPIFGDITYELVNSVATKWTNEKTENSQFIGISKPNTSSDVETVINELLTGLKSDTKEDLEEEFNALIGTINCLVEKDVLKLVNKNVDITTFMTPIKNDKIVASILSNLTKGNALSRAIPSAIQLGLNQMYKAVGVPKEDYDRLKINVTSSEINWNNESSILDEMFANLARVYESIIKEGDIKDTLDYDSLANALEKMRDSSLLTKSKVQIIGTTETSPLNKELTLTLLRCSDMKNIDGMNAVILDIEAFYNEKDEAGNYKLNFKTLLNTLKYAVKISTDLNNANLNVDDVEGLLSGLQDEVVGEIVKDAVVEKLEKEIEKMGVDNVSETTAVKNMVNAVIDYNKYASEHNEDPENAESKLPTMPTEKADVEKTAEGAKELFNVIKNGEGAESGAETKFFASKEDLQNFIIKMKSSEYLWQMSLLNSNSLGFKDASGNTNLTATEYAWASELVGVTYGEGENNKAYYTQAEMQQLFGTQKTTD